MRYLMILEVSQKQAYIFSSTKLRENVQNSEDIGWVTDPRYFSIVAKKAGIEFSREKNLVNSGGGHTVLEFADETTAKAFAFAVSRTVKAEYPEMELFIRTIEYDDKLGPVANLKKLTDELEKKKSVRAAAFYQGTFGVEKSNTNLRKPKAQVPMENRIERLDVREKFPESYQGAYQFEDIGNSKGESSFIAVVHIDGNAMGARIKNIRDKYENGTWEEYKKALDHFSRCIDQDFKASYEAMKNRIAENLEGKAGEMLDLKARKNQTKYYFPIRKLILAGDDVCFVAEGRIGLEAARIFLEELSGRTNQADGEKYEACAGVAIVHQKYPFYKAYELSEMLCSNAKRFLASYYQGARGCAIDWHIEFGELGDDMEALRKNYTTHDGKQMELRPYLLSSEELWEDEPIRRYDNFRRMICAIGNEDIAYARGKLKGLREALKEGEEAAKYYLTSNLIDEFAGIAYQHIYKNGDISWLFKGEKLEEKIFIPTHDGKERSLYFDAIEMLDTFVPLD